MDELLGIDWARFRLALLLAMCLLNLNLDFCSSLNAEGLALLRFRDRVVNDPFSALSNWNDDEAEMDPCSWFGVECSDGKVVILNLKDRCLGGTLAPELGSLIHIKSIILRNNSFSGLIPKEIGELKELETLDLGYNNFSGPLPSDLGNNLSLSILLLDNNRFLGSISPELHELSMLSELQVDENDLTNLARGASSDRRSNTWNVAQARDVDRRLLQSVDSPPPLSSNPKTQKNNKKKQTPSESAQSPSPSSSISPTESPLSSLPSPSPNSISFVPASSPAPTPDLAPLSPAEPPFVVSAPSPSIIFSVPAPANSFPTPSPSLRPIQSEGSKQHTSRLLIWSGVGGASFFIFISVIGFLLCRSKKMVPVKPWATGLSGQLQKAFVTGVPKLKRSELEAACEDFSNIIDSSSYCTMYKGTLSSGVEIAVTSTTVTSVKDWSKNLEGQFRKKIATLSKVNHKNFVNLLGFCEEEEPFTRMMVFEYAPNGTLFEHLHIKESEHLDWAARLRIAMGMAYCLEHMHQLTPRIIHKDMHSSAVYLTEDYAAKISDISFWNEVTTTKMGSTGMELLDAATEEPESNVYSFGVLLLEMITGRLPYSPESGYLVDWALNYLRGEQPSRDMVDPTLSSFQEEELEKLCIVIRNCIHPDPKQRPTMSEATAKLREITAVGPDGATPRLSPLWWAELEILSTEAN